MLESDFTKEEFEEDELREQAALSSVLLDIKSILKSPEGKRFFSYLFEVMDVGGMPEMGAPDEMLRDKLGFLRAGQSIFDLVAEANAEDAGVILAKIREERNARSSRRYEKRRISE